ncbi:MAG: nucleotidyltransferase family protein [Acidimicrobiia bacterium]|nr:nucleotidyltransferase family protein [Acidimicrobiia bacterium]
MATSTAEGGTTAGVVLAAGGGTRFAGDGHKLLAPFRGRPVVAHVVDAVCAAGFDEVIVVTGAVDLAGLLPSTVTVVENEAWALGQAGSLQVALAAAGAAGHDAVVVGLGDQPLIGADAWRSVATSESPIAVATYDGARRNPVRLHRSIWPLLPTDGDQGARGLMLVRPDLVAEVPCQGSPVDIDTVEDLDRWN